MKKKYSPWRVCTDEYHSAWVLIRDVYRTGGVAFVSTKYHSDAEAQKAADELNRKG